jgi:hypothetical protein
MNKAFARADACADYSGFAGPRWPLDETYLDEILSIYYREYFRLFLDAYGKQIAASSRGLTDLIEQSALRLCTFKTAWHYSCAGIREAVVNRASDDDALHAAVACALHFLECGDVEGEFHASSARDFQAIWRNNLYFSNRIGGSRGGVRAGPKLGHEAADLPDASDNPHSRVGLATVCSQNIRLALLTPEAAGVIGCSPPPKLSSSDAALAGTNYQAALELLELHAPAFARWVGRVMAFVSPIEAPAGLMRSGSSREWPGVAEISFRNDAAAIAEMLVHEASHHHFNVLMIIDPITDGSDLKQYYSPFRKCDRPIEMILLAYHAFANVLLYYRECQRTGVDDNGYCKRNEAELIPDLRKLQDALEATGSLTEAGEQLWRPFCSHVAQSA